MKGGLAAMMSVPALVLSGTYKLAEHSKIDIYYKFISKPLTDSRNLLLPQNCVEIHQS